MNIPTYFTLLRIALIPVFVFFFYIPTFWAKVITVIVYMVAALTDVLDGYLARKLGQTSRFGALLDPIADKVMLATVLILLAGVKDINYVGIPFAIIISREILISGLREWMAEQGKRHMVAVSQLAKIKTVTQNVAAVFLLGCDVQVFDWRSVIAYSALYIATGLSVWTLVDYLRAAWPEIKNQV